MGERQHLVSRSARSFCEIPSVSLRVLLKDTLLHAPESSVTVARAKYEILRKPAHTRRVERTRTVASSDRNSIRARAKKRVDGCNEHERGTFARFDWDSRLPSFGDGCVSNSRGRGREFPPIPAIHSGRRLPDLTIPMSPDKDFPGGFPNIFTPFRRGRGFGLVCHYVGMISR